MAKKVANFTQIPNEIIRDRSLSQSEFRILCLIYMFQNAETIHFSYEFIQENSGMSTRTISRCLKSLEGRGLIERTRRYSKSNIYSLISYGQNDPMIGSKCPDDMVKSKELIGSKVKTNNKRTNNKREKEKGNNKSNNLNNQKLSKHLGGLINELL